MRFGEKGVHPLWPKRDMSRWSKTDEDRRRGWGCRKRFDNSVDVEAFSCGIRRQIESIEETISLVDTRPIFIGLQWR